MTVLPSRSPMHPLSSAATVSSQPLSSGASSSFSRRALPTSVGRVPAAASAPVARPKRGRRKKRPDLTDAQRKALRALQNRQATRRSRERSRARAVLLKTQLSRSRTQNSLLAADRDRLLATLASGNANPTRCATPVESRDCFTSFTKAISTLHTQRRNPMNLDVILNHDLPVKPPVVHIDVSHSGFDFRRRVRADTTHFAQETPLVKRFSQDGTSCETRPVSITSPSSTIVDFKKGLHSFS